MKIEKLVTLDTEIEVNISLDDIAAAIEEETDSMPGVLSGLNNVAIFLNAIPDSLITEMNDKQKALVKAFLTENAARFS